MAADSWNFSNELKSSQFAGIAGNAPFEEKLGNESRNSAGDLLGGVCKSNYEELVKKQVAILREDQKTNLLKNPESEQLLKELSALFPQ
jgi:hypothetical protein